MRTDVKDLQQTQSASGANVQPTKQATIIEPSAEAINHRDTTVEHWRPCRHKQIMAAPFSDKPETYSIVIGGSTAGSRLEPTSSGRKSVRVETIIEAYHPFMAIGQAVAEFMDDIHAQIDEVHIYQRVVKTIKPRK